MNQGLVARLSTKELASLVVNESLSTKDRLLVNAEAARRFAKFELIIEEYAEEKCPQ